MTIEELTALDVASLAADDAVMLMWATFPLLPEALVLLKAWGFKYKTAFVWDKGHGAFGSYHDADAELLLIGTVGSCVPEADTKEKQIQHFARGKHSAKPEEWRALIDKLWPNGPRIELFRRGDVPDGWQTWGAEADHD
jgi:N6-adenosine-specific RNA methylase IME4